MKRLLKFFVAAATCGFAGFASAQSTDNDSLDISATVAQTCSITAGAVAFGAYDPVGAHPAGTPLDQTGTIQVTCTKGASSLEIGLDVGGNPAGAQRRMANGTERLAYDLFQPSGPNPGDGCNYATAAAWGDTATVDRFVPTATWAAGTPFTFNVCGRVPGGQDVGAGNYADTVQATIYF